MSYKRPGYVANAEVRKINEMISAREMQERDEQLLDESPALQQQVRQEGLTRLASEFAGGSDNDLAGSR